MIPYSHKQMGSWWHSLPFSLLPPPSKNRELGSVYLQARGGNRVAAVLQSLNLSVSTHENNSAAKIAKYKPTYSICSACMLRGNLSAKLQNEQPYAVTSPAGDSSCYKSWGEAQGLLQSQDPEEPQIANGDFSHKEDYLLCAKSCRPIWQMHPKRGLGIGGRYLC